MLPLFSIMTLWIESSDREQRKFNLDANRLFGSFLLHVMQYFLIKISPLIDIFVLLPSITVFVREINSMNVIEHWR